MSRREVLRAFLKAVPAGLVELRWGIICPSCMTSSQQVRALEEIKAEGHCQLCDITFDLDLDRAVEATFLPHPAVRRVPDGHVLHRRPRRARRTCWCRAASRRGRRGRSTCRREPGRYRVFVARRRVGDAGGGRRGRDGGRGLHRRDGGASGALARRAGRRAPCPIDVRGRAPREDRAPRLRERGGDGARGVDPGRVPHHLLERAAEARDAAQGGARGGPLQRSHRLDGALHRRSATPPRSVWWTTTSTCCAR